jgi:hypothetical protein
MTVGKKSDFTKLFLLFSSLLVLSGCPTGGIHRAVVQV